MKRRDIGTLAALALSGAALSSCGGGGGGGPSSPALPAASTQDIVFVSNRDDKTQTELYTMKADGSNQTRVTNTAGNEADPAWSPDKRYVAFSLGAGNVLNTSMARDIYVRTVATGETRRLTNTTTYNAQPAWSPDGKRIAFTSNRDGNLEIYTMSAQDGSGLRRLTNRTQVADVAPDWSPEGRFIAFASGSYSAFPRSIPAQKPRSGGSNLIERDIYIMNADGTEQKKLTGFGDARDPAFDATGEDIFFSSANANPAGNGVAADLYSMKTDGTNLLRIETGFSSDDPAPSPTDSRVIFVVGAFGDSPEIFIINRDGSDVKRLTQNEAFDGMPDWK